METKPILFIGSSRDDLREFPAEVRKALGDELLRVQNGLMPVDFKPLKDVGKGAYEIRVHLNGAWRVIYVAKFANAVYVLHAFEKKTQKTSPERHGACEAAIHADWRMTNEEDRCALGRQPDHQRQQQYLS